ncbi:MAG: RsmB/NOP family class I SAM-dependent RNA methyltransferase [Hyphomicrobiaceae bacterium]
MKTGGRIAAAIEVLAALETQHRPAADALSDWGKSHRFAGSGDRSAIGSLVYDVLRQRSSLAAQMGEATPRALAIAAAPRAFGLSLDELAAALDGSEHAPQPLSDDERARLAAGLPADVDDAIAADVPEWLAHSLRHTFGDRMVAEGRALAERAPVDLRVNTLKADRDKVLKALSRFAAEATRFSPIGVRIPPSPGATKSPHVEGETAHGKGWFEVQDEGSQIAAAMAGAGPRQQVLDLCAGAGGKTLALAAAMHNTGQIYAYDDDKRQLRPIFERLKRAGVRNVQVLDGGDEAALRALGPRFDVVLVDAPCTGSGTWRRRPDSKWRLKPEALHARQKQQMEVLQLAALLVKPGGRIVYVTCSILESENGDIVDRFLGFNADLRLVPYADVWRQRFASEPPASADGGSGGLLLTPASHGTDGFFIATLERSP